MKVFYCLREKKFKLELPEQDDKLQSLKNIFYTLQYLSHMQELIRNHFFRVQGRE